MFIAKVYKCFKRSNPFGFVQATSSMNAWTKHTNNLLLERKDSWKSENPSRYDDGCSIARETIGKPYLNLCFSFSNFGKLLSLYARCGKKELKQFLFKL